MSYLQNSLSRGEEIHTVFHLNWSVYIPVVLWGAAALATFIYLPKWVALVLLFIALGQLVKIRSIEQGVTNKRVVLKTGVVGRKTEEMKLEAIETVEINQSIWGRMLGYGTVKVTGRGESIIVFENIDEPLKVKRTIESVEAFEE